MATINAGKLDLVEASSARSSEHALDDPAERAAQQERLRALARDGGTRRPHPRARRVLTEVRSGRRSTDVLVDRLLSAIGGTNSIYAPLTVETASRAGVLRAAAQVGRPGPSSAIDAQVVAIGEERSYRRAVTIVTTDRTDIAALVEVTGRPNIAIHAV